MIAGSPSLDTSAVLRLLVGQPTDQYQQATRFLREPRFCREEHPMKSDLVQNLTPHSRATPSRPKTGWDTGWRATFSICSSLACISASASGSPRKE